MDKEACSFTFSISKAARFLKKDKYFDEQLEQDCWFNLYYPDLDARLYFSYYSLSSEGVRLKELQEDAFKMSYDHSVRANAINEQRMSNKTGSAQGIKFSITGQSASPSQFFLTDGKEHFLRGALYFDARMDRDSLDPIIDYLERDIDTIISTLEWK